MAFCCELGSEYSSGKNILYESDNFFVVPSIGQMEIEGYVLLCSKEHYVGIGDVPKECEPELEKVLDKTKKIISQTYGSKVLVFEHGPRSGCSKGGGCLDHAHLHLVPSPVDVMDFLKEKFQAEEIKNFGRLREISAGQQSSYLFIETQDNKRYVIKVDFPLPSQYLRQIIASKSGIDNWDWREYPDNETFQKTIRILKDKF